MMAVDTSALVAIALDEPKAQACRDALRSETSLLMSARTMAEAMIVAGHNGFAEAMQALIVKHAERQEAERFAREAHPSRRQWLVRRHSIKASERPFRKKHIKRSSSVEIRWF